MTARGIARVGIDGAGGMIVGGGQDFVTVDGARVAVKGDSVAAHTPKHFIQCLVEGAAWCTIEGRPISRAGDLASCGHAASGADWIEIDAE